MQVDLSINNWMSFISLEPYIYHFALNVWMFSNRVQWYIGVEKRYANPNVKLLYCHFSGLDDPTNQSMMFKKVLIWHLWQTSKHQHAFLSSSFFFSGGHRIEYQKAQRDFDLDTNRKKNIFLFCMEQYMNHVQWHLFMFCFKFTSIAFWTDFCCHIKL